MPNIYINQTANSDILQFLHNMSTAHEDFNVKVKNPNSYENRMVASFSAFLVQKTIIENQIHQSVSLLQILRNLLQPSSTRDQSNLTVNTEDEEFNEKAVSSSNAKKIQEKIDELSTSIAKLNEQKMDLYQEYETCKQTLRSNVASKINLSLQGVLNTQGNTQFNQSVQEGILEVYENRAKERDETLEKIRTTIRPMLHPAESESRSEAETLKIAKTEEKKYDMQTGILAFGKLQSIAEDFRLKFDIKTTIKAVRGAEGLIEAYQKAINALESDFSNTNDSVRETITELKQEQNALRAQNPQAKVGESAKAEANTHNFGLNKYRSPTTPEKGEEGAAQKAGAKTAFSTPTPKPLR